ncbi:MAG: hypothetical protein HY882_15465 [Deltaproteobacteria bacterium]|nr:hypothetical protein [Deltaproteobacteria bacterium]
MIAIKKLWMVAVATILGLAMFIPVIQAEPIDMINCSSGTTNVLVATEELTILTTEIRGISRDNLGSKVFDNMTYHCAGLFKVTAGKRAGTTNCKFMDPSGDYFVVEALYLGAEGDWKFIYGTGKWKGVTGGGKTKSVTSGKPITPGTSQGCGHVTGTYELKK